MKNVNIETKGHSLVITLDLSAPATPSKSGKTLIIATSGGNQPVGSLPDGRKVVLGLNCYTSR